MVADVRPSSPAHTDKGNPHEDFTPLDLSGTFASVSLQGFGNGFDYSVIYDYAADLVKLQVLNVGGGGEGGGDDASGRGFVSRDALLRPDGRR